jgi:hypothetical protein
MDERMLLLWGDMSTGKTSLLATGLLGPGAAARLPMIDWQVSLPVVQAALLDTYHRLANNLQTIPTVAGIPPGVRVTLRGSGRTVVFQDVMGERVRRPEPATTGELLQRADAVLFVLAWGAAERRQQFDAIRTALPALGARPRALAFTMCEQVLDQGHPAWREGAAQTDWWTELDDWDANETETLRALGAVWPTSSYGFGPDGRPACVLDEFGETIPYDISPVNGTALLGWLLGRLAQ